MNIDLMTSHYAAITQVIPSVSWEEYLWQMPLVLVGHLVAKAAEKNGTKGVERKTGYTKKIFDLMKQIQDLRLREGK